MLSAFEFMSAAAVGCVANAYPASRIPFEADAAACALVDRDRHAGARRAARGSARSRRSTRSRANTWCSTRPARRPRFWRIRDALPAAVAQDGIPLSFDVSFPRGALAAFVDEAERWIAARTRRCAATRSGISATAAAISSCRSRTPVRTAAGHCSRWLRGALYERVVRAGGCFSAEHGVGPVNVAYYRKHVPANGGSPPPSSTPSTRWV